MYDNLIAKITDNEKQQVLNDISMATIFKLLRIQYALSHQDEKDKQDIFLMGGKIDDKNQPKCNQSDAMTQAEDGLIDQHSVQSNFAISRQSKR